MNCKGHFVSRISSLYLAVGLHGTMNIRHEDDFNMLFRVNVAKHLAKRHELRAEKCRGIVSAGVENENENFSTLFKLHTARTISIRLNFDSW